MASCADGLPGVRTTRRVASDHLPHSIAEHELDAIPGPVPGADTNGDSDIRTATAQTPSKEIIEFSVDYRRAERHTGDPGALECAAAGLRVPLSGAALTAS